MVNVLALGVCLAGCAMPMSASKSAREAPSTPVFHVDVVDRTGADPFAFTPKQITVGVGARVTWRNQSNHDHTVTDTGDHPELNSGVQHMIRPGASWSYDFRRAGTYHYYCLVHPYMKGTVIVQQ